MYHIIFNPKSKGSRGEDVCRIVLAQLRIRSLPFILHTTDHPRHAEELTRELTSQNKPCTLLIIGGDGTLNEVINGIVDPSLVTLGLIPSGSGNDFARAMKIPRDPGKALELILHQKPVPVHYGHMSAGRHKRRFMISCGAGFDSEVCRAVHYSKLKKLFNRIFLGNLVYGFISVRKLLFRTLFSAKVSCDSDETSLFFKDITFITAFNSAYEGGGFKFCPPADPKKDGLQLFCIHDLPLYKIPLLFPLAHAGRHLAFTQYIALQEAKKAVLRFSAPVCIHTDGEVWGFFDQLTVESSADTVDMYLP